MKVYTLNLYSTCVICDCFISFANIIEIVALYKSNPTLAEGFRCITFLSPIIKQWAATAYRLFILFFTTVSYLAFASPVKYQKSFAKRSWLSYYAAIHIMCFIYGVIDGYIKSYLFDETLLQYISSFTSNIATISISIATIVMMIKATIAVKAHRRIVAWDYKRNRYRRHLVSFLIYCIPLNILTIPAGVYIITSAAHFFVEDYDVFRAIYNFAATTELQFRTILVSLCTLIALPCYRNAARRFFGC
ncbi:hypothetical protein Tcan_01383 [Toxocara canis]|uniref:G protein-coupled receptor n=1 Tax=Toxocara canis TaxID=6265 RepID=A0A0B2V5R9_TOXCA|nr:hypothetical protein Tcan_01383 [Toxocara canis]